MTDKRELKARLLTTVERVTREHRESAHRLAEVVIASDEAVLAFYSELDSTSIGFLAAETKDMSTDDLTEFVRLTECYDGMWQRSFKNTEKYLVRSAVALAPLLHLIEGYGPNAADVADKQKKMHGLFATKDYDRNRGVFRDTFRFMFGGYARPSEYSLNKTRGEFLRLVSDNQLSHSESVWFGREWKSIVPIWKTMEKGKAFSREYAEELISGTKHHGTALIEGIL